MPRSKWRLVADDPPPKEKEVWTFGPDWDEPLILEVWFDRTSGKFTGFCHNAWGIVSGVTHWMPIELPSPPESEDAPK